MEDPTISLQIRRESRAASVVLKLMLIKEARLTATSESGFDFEAAIKNYDKLRSGPFLLLHFILLLFDLLSCSLTCSLT